MELGDWRNSIVNQLQARNKYETAAFQDIITFQSRLFDNVNTLKNENLQLTLVNERIRYSNTDSSLAGGGNVINEKIQALEQKILIQQEELTSLHRRRGESAQQIINLNAQVHDLEKQLQAKDIISVSEVILFFQDENRSLADRFLKYKAKDADKMNEENEHFLKSSNPTAFIINTIGRVSFGKKSDKLRKELEEAAREGGSRSSGGSPGGSADDKILDSMPYYTTSLPNKVALRFSERVNIHCM
ncbi:unnamed protein product [Diatraea saccharalis]|uniref:Autophagy-related protein 16 domain-containing protein n=1 Tax=Diatraea saccharalis TaxID=40085 RepID=A0A9N9R081_9NEOP|nr:unnamed protein product [Diatraea saccharalis]